jgi:enoyl-CoA hydratase/carnithine racemase
VAADHARFAVTEAKVGRGSPWAAPLSWMLPRRIVLELLMTGDPIDADRAYTLGLVNRVVPLAELRETAQTLAQTLRANAPLSVQASKRMIYAGQAVDFDQADAIWEPVYTSADAQEGPTAFREKRPPRWQGR